MRNRLLFVVAAGLAIAVGCDCRGCGGGGGTDGGPDGDVIVTDGGRDGGRDAGDASVPIDPCSTGAVQCGGTDGGFSLDGGDGGGSGSGVQVGPGGSIILDSTTYDLHYAWIANDTNGWVSKYDTRTLREVGRYWAVLPVPSANLYYDSPTHPSRTALDLNADVWVANRSIGCVVGTNCTAVSLAGSVTKILNDVATCADRNGDGVINTSRDVNDSGVIGDGPGEFIVPMDRTNINQYDECVVKTVPLGANLSGDIRRARGLAVSATFETAGSGDVWVGMHQEKRLYRIDSTSGNLLPANADGGMWIDMPFGPYGLAVDSQQRLWVAGAPGDHRAPDGGRRTVIGLVDTVNRVPIDPFIQAPDAWGNASMYGIAIDGKDRVWLGAWEGGAYAYRYERPLGSPPSAGVWTRFYVGNYSSQDGGTKIGRTRGITVDKDGIVWVDSDKSNSITGADSSQLVAIYADDGGLRPFVTDAGTPVQFMDFTDVDSKVAIGVGIDNDGNIWVNNYSGNVVKVDRNSGNFVRLPKQTGNLYTYSDFTGYQLRNFTAPRGVYRMVVTGCSDMTNWVRVLWDSYVPANTAISLNVTPSNNPTDFSAGPRLGPWSSSPAEFDGGVPQSHYLLLEFTLRNTDRVSTPELRNVGWQFYCGGVIGERPQDGTQ